MRDLKDTVKQQNKIASDWLIDYVERKREHEEKRQEIYLNPVSGRGAAGSSAEVSKPTESIAVKLTDHDLSNTAKWLDTIETVYNMIGYKKQLLLRFRQECRMCMSLCGGRPGWIRAVQLKFGEIINWCPAESTLKDMWRSIVELTIHIAFLKKCRF